MTKNLRIALVTETFPPEVNGVAMTIGRIVNGLLGRGHIVQLIRPRQANEGGAPITGGLEEVLTSGMPVPGYPELRLGFPAKAMLLKLWLGSRPDIVHVVTEGPLGSSAVAAARQLQLPLTSSFHTNFQSYSQNYGFGVLKNLIDAYLRRFHNRTQVTMVPTEALRVDLQNRGYENVKILSRGIDVDLFSPAKRSQALRNTWDVKEDDLVILLVGRLAKEKNAGLVVSAFCAIQQNHPRAKLVFVGDGPLRKTLQNACPEAIFTGVKKGEDLAMHYASADIFLFPSLTETYGNVVPEALASGLAVVSYSHAAAKELLVEGMNGMPVSFNDEVAFVRTAVQVATDVPLRSTIRSAAAHSVAHLGWSGIFDSFLNNLYAAKDAGGDSHRIKACPILTFEPSPSSLAKVNPLAVSTITVEPC
jgi:glycosyltransferase involved in cell wall biosynthesis